MILLDAYAVIAYLRAESGAGVAVRAVLGTGVDGSRAAISAVNATEVVDHLVRHGTPPEEAVLDLAQLDLHTVDVDEAIAWDAGLLRGKHYHRTRRAVSLADCIAAATLLRADVEALATADPHLLDLVHEEGGAVHPLPATDGSLWSP